MHFSDEADIKVEAGKGGNGACSLRHEKFVFKGGPDGGNGGHGGSVIFEGDENINTLATFLTRKIFKAPAGTNGKGDDRYGSDADDLILKVPVGTLIYEQESRKLIADITEHGQQVVVARGGMGGKGNANFVSSVRQCPEFAELGEPGEYKELHLELKLIAEVAIVGFPNAGKSTLISRISNARPKIANYPFTTLIPNLGTVKVDGTDFVVADIPGLIEGAHEGKGLGVDFLRHIERTKIIIHLVDIMEDDPRDQFEKINKELKLYSKVLAEKPQIVVFSKIDASISDIIDDMKKKFKKEKPLFISAVTGEGIDKLLYKIKDEVIKLREKEAKESPKKTTEERKVFRPHLEMPNIRDFKTWKISDTEYAVSGKRIEQVAIMTDMSKVQAHLRMFDILKKIGAYRELKRLGAQPGDKINISTRTFEFIDVE